MSNECKITLTAPVTHDRENYGVGDVLTMARSQAERLERLGCGVIEGMAKQKQKTPEKTTVVETEKAPPPSDEETPLNQTHGHHAQTGESLTVEALLGKLDPKEMTQEELEAELTAAGIEIREGMSEKALMARVIKLRKDGE